MEPLRRSSRATKGRNSRLEKERAEEAALLKDDGEVRCPTCGMTTDTYVEDGREMIQCEQCNTWQHVECVVDKVPEKYICEACQTRILEDEEYKEQEQEQARPTKKAKKTSKEPENVQDLEKVNTTRYSVAKNFVSVFQQRIPDDYGEPKGELAAQWGFELEKNIYEHFAVKPMRKSQAASTSPGPKYLEKARTLLFNLKNQKNELMKRVLEKKISLEELSQLTSEQMLNPDFQKFADDVRKQSINQSVLKVQDNLPRVKITHKGEEVIENDEYEAAREAKIEEEREHIKVKHEEEPQREEETNLNPSLLFPSAAMQDDDDDEVAEHSLDEDPELDKILNGETDKKDVAYDPNDAYDPEEAYDPKDAYDPIPIPVDVWSGDVTFPEYGTFKSVAKYAGSTLSKTPTEADARVVSSLLKQLGTEGLVEIEGRLDEDKAEPYLAQVTRSRDLYVVLFEPMPLENTFEEEENESNCQRLFRYFAKRNKYGVVGSRPTCIKDFYLIPMRAGEGVPKSFLQIGNWSKIQEDNSKDRLFGLLVVKRGYRPM